MTLREEIRELRDETLSDLSAVHDYYVHTKWAWQTVQTVIVDEPAISIENQLTGSVVDETELFRLVRTYVRTHLASATFQQFVSRLEHFTFGLIRAWLTAYPQSLSNKESVPFRVILDAADRDEIIAGVVEREVLQVAYKGVGQWFEYLKRLTGLDRPSEDQIGRVAEVKATRDVLVHNDGVVNSLYVVRSGSHARFAEGEVLELPEPYHRETWTLLREVVGEVCDAALGNVK